jgi:putative nucleotidyltransferase with HDIG domain
MITFESALKLLHKYGLKPERIRHCQGVADYAATIAGRIHQRHPELPVDPQKVRIAALLHDIGRGQPGNHETNSVRILQEEGLPELAAIVMHGTLYEMNKLRGNDDPAFLPQTLENKLVAYADTRFRLSPVSLEERIADIKKRRADNPQKIAAVEMSVSRMKALEAEILSLAGEV